MYLILAPADIFYLTGVTIHEVGEVFILIQNTKYPVLRSSKNGEGITTKDEKIHNEEAQKINNEQGRMNNRGRVFCDPRTSGLFDATQFEVISEREAWGGVLQTYGTLETDPDVLTQTLRAQLEGYGVMLTMAPSPITEQRIIKTPEEIQKLQESQSINKAVLDALQIYLQIGVTEEEIARRIQILQLGLGASGPSFPPIVAFGENTAVPHHSPTPRALQAGDVVLIDMGVVYKGYCSDMTRCLMPMNNEEGIMHNWG